MWFSSMRRSLETQRALGPVGSRLRSTAAIEPLEQRRLMSAAPSVSVGDLTFVEGNTGERSALVEVSLSRASNKSVAVTFRTEDGTATAVKMHQRATRAGDRLIQGVEQSVFPCRRLDDAIFATWPNLATSLTDK